jgi:DNA-binding transcriptional ArsR family regulator
MVTGARGTAPGEVRDAVLAYLRAHPDGAHRAEMARAVYGDDGLPSRRKVNTALRKLELHGCAERSPASLWRPTGKDPPTRRPQDPGPVGARLLAALADRAAATGELARAAGAGGRHPYATKHLEWLRDRGFVERVARGRWRATDAGRAALARMGERRCCPTCGRPMPRKKP